MIEKLSKVTIIRALSYWITRRAKRSIELHLTIKDKGKRRKRGEN